MVDEDLITGEKCSTLLANVGKVKVTFEMQLRRKKDTSSSNTESEEPATMNSEPMEETIPGEQPVANMPARDSSATEITAARGRGRSRTGNSTPRGRGRSSNRGRGRDTSQDG